MLSPIIIKVTPSHTKPECEIFQAYFEGEFITNTVKSDFNEGVRVCMEQAVDRLAKRGIKHRARPTVQRSGYNEEPDYYPHHA